MGCIGRCDIYLAGRRDRNLYRDFFSLVVHQRMFLETAKDRRDVLCHLPQIASMALMDFKSLDLDWGRCQVPDGHSRLCHCSRGRILLRDFHSRNIAA